MLNDSSKRVQGPHGTPKKLSFNHNTQISTLSALTKRMLKCVECTECKMLTQIHVGPNIQSYLGLVSHLNAAGTTPQGDPNKVPTATSSSPFSHLESQGGRNCLKSLKLFLIVCY